MRRALSLVTVASLAPPALARDYEAELQIDSLEELYNLRASGDLEAASLEILEALYQRPLDINRADRFLLYDLPGVTYALAEAIVAHRAETGGYATLEELAAVPGMTAEILASLASFATVGAGRRRSVAATRSLRGEARAGSILRQGFGRDEIHVDRYAERERGPEGYLRVRATGLTSMGAGALLTYRRRTDAWWDYSRGGLVSNGPTGMVDADNLYLYAGYGNWSLILGSYAAGFGERLTFDTTTRVQPHGWYENDTVVQDNQAGSIDPRSGQFGVAATLDGMSLGAGWLEATVFASWVREDLYQYDFQTGCDSWYGSNRCASDSDCPSGYSCRDDRVCGSTRIYDAGDMDAPSFRYESLRDAYDERLAGANATYSIDERSHVGVTAYWATTDLNLATGAKPAFAFAARLPRRFSEFGAAGVNLRAGAGPVDVGAEYARTTGQGNAAYLRAVVAPAVWAEVTVSGRYYDAAYLNPHARPRAQPDELFGLPGRNEVGGRIDATFRPTPGLRLVTQVDLWGNPWLPVFDEEGDLHFEAKRDVPVDLFASQRAAWSFTSREDLSLLLEYRNKDLSANSRAEAYQLGDLCDGGLADAYCGRGESRKLQVRLATARLPRLRLWASYTATWEDVRAYENRFDVQYNLRGHASVEAWPGARCYAQVGLWLHDKQLAVFDADEPFFDRAGPRVDSFLEMRQRLGRFVLWARYGLIHYDDERQQRYAWYHLGKLNLEARF